MKTKKIRDYTVGPTESFFFDTNVWIYLFAPVANSKQYKQKLYSLLLKDILSRNAVIFINSLVVSEYVNAVLRLEFNKWKISTGNSNADFKHDFRQTGEYQSALNDVKLQVDEILRVTTRRPDDFHVINIDGIVRSMGTSLDFCDAFFVDTCRKANLILVSDDTDITNADLPFVVITA